MSREIAADLMADFGFPFLEKWFRGEIEPPQWFIDFCVSGSQIPLEVGFLNSYQHGDIRNIHLNSIEVHGTQVTVHGDITQMAPTAEELVLIREITAHYSEQPFAGNENVSIVPYEVGSGEQVVAGRPQFESSIVQSLIRKNWLQYFRLGTGLVQLRMRPNGPVGFATGTAVDKCEGCGRSWYNCVCSHDDMEDD